MVTGKMVLNDFICDYAYTLVNLQQMWTITKLNIFYRFGDACDNCPDDRNPDQGTCMKLNIEILNCVEICPLAQCYN